MPDYLLKTKIYIPPPTPRLVSRGHLLEMLNNSLTPGKRLALISAPAGFGKSTLASEWILSVKNGNINTLIPKFCWLSLDNEDNDPTRFLTYLAASIESAQIEALEEPLRQIRSSQLSSPKVVLGGLINPLAGILENLVIVLDDYHVISDSSIHEGLVYFLNHIPSNVRLLITTRADPPFPLARLRARGQMVELRSADLRFDLEETEYFLNKVMGLNLKRDDLQELENQTEGWVTGLHLAALSMHGQAEPSSFIAGFTGSHRFILDYLLEEVLQLQTDTIQEFLLDTSILERMNGSLCDFLFNRDPQESGLNSSQMILELLEQNNLFIVPLDEQHQWYRYHHLFADFLHSRLQFVNPDKVASLHQRAAQWFEQNELFYDAINHFLQYSKISSAGYDEAIHLIEEAVPAALQRGEINLLQNWLNSIPEELVKSNPRLCIYYAWSLVFGSPRNQIDFWIEQLKQLLVSVEGSEGADEIRNHLQVLQLFFFLNHGDPNKAFQLSRQIVSRIPEKEHFLQGMAQLFVNIDSAMAGEDFVFPVQPAVDSGPVNYHLGANYLLNQLSLFTRAIKFKMDGHLYQAERLLRQSIQIAEASHQTQSVLPFPAYTALGDLLYERNDLDAAEHYARKTFQIKQYLMHPEARLDYYYVLARIHRARGDINLAYQDLAQMREFIEEPDMPWFGELLDMYEIRLTIQQHNLEIARQWVSHHKTYTNENNTMDPRFLQMQIQEKHTLSRINLALEKYIEAENIERDLLEHGKELGLAWVIEANILLALALSGQSRKSEAVETIIHALTLAEQEGFVRIFLDEGEPMITLLEMIASTPMDPIIKKYIDTLLLFTRPAGSEEHAKRVNQPSMLDPLSEREIEVLHLISTGFSNKMIAERLYLAESTVKTHINHIYAKLGVDSRTQAVIRARELNLFG